MVRRIRICSCTEAQLERGETCGLASCHNRNRRRRRGPRHPHLRSDGPPINAVPTVEAGVDGRVLDLLNSHPDFDRSAFAWVGSEHMGDGLFCASIYTGIAADSPYMWIGDPAEVIAKTGVRVAPSRAELEGNRETAVATRAARQMPARSPSMAPPRLASRRLHRNSSTSQHST